MMRCRGLGPNLDNHFLRLNSLDFVLLNFVFEEKQLYMTVDLSSQCFFACKTSCLNVNTDTPSRLDSSIRIPDYSVAFPPIFIEMEDTSGTGATPLIYRQVSSLSDILQTASYYDATERVAVDVTKGLRGLAKTTVGEDKTWSIHLRVTSDTDHFWQFYVSNIQSTDLQWMYEEKIRWNCVQIISEHFPYIISYPSFVRTRSAERLHDFARECELFTTQQKGRMTLTEIASYALQTYEQDAVNPRYLTGTFVGRSAARMTAPERLVFPIPETIELRNAFYAAKRLYLTTRREEETRLLVVRSNDDVIVRGNKVATLSTKLFDRLGISQQSRRELLNEISELRKKIRQLDRKIFNANTDELRQPLRESMTELTTLLRQRLSESAEHDKKFKPDFSPPVVQQSVLTFNPSFPADLTSDEELAFETLIRDMVQPRHNILTTRREEEVVCEREGSYPTRHIRSASLSHFLMKDVPHQAAKYIGYFLPVQTETGCQFQCFLRDCFSSTLSQTQVNSDYDEEMISNSNFPDREARDATLKELQVYYRLSGKFQYLDLLRSFFNLQEVGEAMKPAQLFPTCTPYLYVASPALFVDDALRMSYDSQSDTTGVHNKVWFLSHPYELLKIERITIPDNSEDVYPQYSQTVVYTLKNEQGQLQRVQVPLSPPLPPNVLSLYVRREDAKQEQLSRLTTTDLNGESVVFLPTSLNVQQEKSLANAIRGEQMLGLKTLVWLDKPSDNSHQYLIAACSTRHITIASGTSGVIL